MKLNQMQKNILVALLLGIVLFMVVCGISACFMDTSKGTIVIDVGHGGKDPGAVQGEIFEKHINLAVAKQLRGKLKKLGYRVKMTREQDEFLELSERCEIANESETTFFVSIHCNSWEDNAGVSGIETYYYTEGSEGMECAEGMIDYLSSETDLKIKSAKQGDLYVLRNTKAPAVLVEIGYLSNAKECTQLTSDDYQKKLGASLGEAIDQTILAMQNKEK